MNQKKCPVLADTQAIVALSNHSLVSCLQQITHDMSSCEVCPLKDTCIIRANILNQLDAAVFEISTEWNLAITLQETNV